MKDADVSSRISMLRFLMIFGVVVVHTPPTWEVHEVDGTIWAYIISFFQNGIFLSGVPVLTTISGFLLFRSDSDLKYWALLKTKARTLLVPFMVFNLGHILLQLMLRLITGKWLGEDLLAYDFDAWMNSLFSLRKAPENDPLHFLRELIVLVVLSPVFGFFIRKLPVVGMAAVSLFFLTNSDGFLMNRSDMATEFYVGGLAAVYTWNVKALDKYWISALMILCVSSAVVAIFEISDITWLRLMAPFLVWSAASRLVGSPLGKWFAYLSIYSFFVYVTHAPLMRLSWVVFQKTLPSTPVPFFTGIAPFAVTIACIGLYKTISSTMPRPLDWALGSRNRKAQAKPNSSVAVRTVEEPSAKAEP